jgi:hypothetical protein
VKIRLFSFLSILALAFLQAGCEKPAPPASPHPDDKVLFQAIEDNVQAINKKDLDAFMATIHPNAPTFASTRDTVGKMFRSVDLKFTVKDLKVITSSPEEAQVSFVQTTEKAGGDAPFQNRIMEGVHTLRPDNGKWKIFGTAPIKVTPLNAAVPNIPEVTPASPQTTPPPEPAPKTAPPEPAPATPADKPAPQ